MPRFPWSMAAGQPSRTVAWISRIGNAKCGIWQKDSRAVFVTRRFQSLVSSECVSYCGRRLILSIVGRTGTLSVSALGPLCQANAAAERLPRRCIGAHSMRARSCRSASNVAQRRHCCVPLKRPRAGFAQSVESLGRAGGPGQQAYLPQEHRPPGERVAGDAAAGNGERVPERSAPPPPAAAGSSPCRWPVRERRAGCA